MVEHAKPGDKVLVQAVIEPGWVTGEAVMVNVSDGEAYFWTPKDALTTEADIRADERAKLAALTTQSGADQAAWAFVTQHMPDASEVQALAAVHDLTQMLLFAANVSACLADKHEGGAA